MPPPNLPALLELARYPGRFEGEHAVIGDWLKDRGHLYDRIEFNVPLGTGIDPPAALVEPWRAKAIAGSMMRADIICWLGGGVVIIEAKDRARTDALGQLFMYRSLWLEGSPAVPVHALEVICRRVNDDALVGFVTNGVTVRVYDEAA